MSRAEATQQFADALRQSNTGAAADAAQTPSRLIPGDEFLRKTAVRVQPLWGNEDEVLWSEQESLILTGSPSSGKTTVAQHVTLGLIGLQDMVLGYPVARRDRVLYLAMDRPRQIARSFQRMVTEADYDILHERLIVWEGPPPADIAKEPSLLLGLTQEADAQVVIIDSLKDAALGLTDDKIGAAVNRAIQMCLAAGVDVLVIHHQKKQSGSGNGGAPTDLTDVYGSVWITAGAGSVVLLHGNPGSGTAVLRHLKPPAEPVGPLHVKFDYYTGAVTRADTFDPLAWLRSQHQPVTAQHLAAAAYGDQDRSAVERARRDLDRLTRRSLACRHDGHRGGSGGGTATTWTAAVNPGQDPLPDPPEDPL